MFLLFAESTKALQNQRVVTIESVIMEPSEKNTKNPKLSMYIRFFNHGINSEYWQFGFYMLGTSFYQSFDNEQKHNLKLRMDICDEQNNCSKLRYEKTGSIRNTDSSQGCTTILAPKAI